MVSNRRARSVLVFSAQSFRRSLSRAVSRAIASLTRLRRFEPRRARATLRCRRRRRCRSAPPSPGTWSSSPVDRAAETATPRSMPTAWPLPGAGTGPGPAPKAPGPRPARPPGPRQCLTPGGTARDQRNRTHPAFGTRTSPVWRDRRRTSPGLTATTRNPSLRPALRHDGRGGRAGEAAGTWTCEHTSEQHRYSWGGEAAFPPRPEGRGLHAANPMTVFVALGDSITVGMGDPAPGGGWRGWAALLGATLDQPDMHNLATLGALAADVERLQL